jgi:hypothetical protein
VNQHPEILEKAAQDNFLVEPLKTWQVETDRARDYRSDARGQWLPLN